MSDPKLVQLRVFKRLAQGCGDRVDDVAQHLLEPSQPVSHLSETTISNGTLHVVAGS